ncbi:hypothetical protein [Nocardia mangyaensis]|uniref:hypothetical protein n=1 Tax=Nocardia mangyaensis TaxID=2213200 RepID=UPI0012EBC7FC|nr:hypothetical protein [Nocardia mangyaensis]
MSTIVIPNCSRTVAVLDARSCEVHIAAESLDWAAFCLASVGAPFVVHGPLEAIELITGWGSRLLAATENSGEPAPSTHPDRGPSQE